MIRSLFLPLAAVIMEYDSLPHQPLTLTFAAMEVLVQDTQHLSGQLFRNMSRWLINPLHR
ncbi:MAG: hypothetical protein AAF151_24040 [Cyanobacteria bacterium J06656_5]